MKIVFDHDSAFLESEQEDKRRARHLPSCGEVILYIALTLEPPKSGRGKPLKSC